MVSQERYGREGRRPDPISKGIVEGVETPFTGREGQPIGGVIGFRGRFRRERTAFQILVQERHDRKYAGLELGHVHTYRALQSHRRKLDLPFAELCAPQSYRDVLAWLSIFHQDPLMVVAADKYWVRDYVKAVVGEEFLKELLFVSDALVPDDFRELHYPLVIKATHDSSSTVILNEFEAESAGRVAQQTEERLGRVYGRNKGEWHYQFVTPRVLIEPYIPPRNGHPAELKFYCISGRVHWARVYRSRPDHSMDYLVSPNGKPLGLSMSATLDSPIGISLPTEWDELVRAAEALAAPFPHVSVDFLVGPTKSFFSELTFFPGAQYRNTTETRQFMAWAQMIPRTRLDPLDGAPKTEVEVLASERLKASMTS